MTDRQERGKRVAALGELPSAIGPPRDLWPGIEAAISHGDRAGAPPPAAPRRSAAPTAAVAAFRGRTAWLAAAAMVACVGVGVWLGRDLLPRAGAPSPATANVAVPANSAGAEALPGVPMAREAAWVSDPRYTQQRAALLQSLQSQLATLPAPTREKVAASLATVEKAKQDLEQELGRDPGNALLQELLIDTYQDEMRVLTDVHEAGTTGRGI